MPFILIVALASVAAAVGVSPWIVVPACALAVGVLAWFERGEQLRL